MGVICESKAAQKVLQILPIRSLIWLKSHNILKRGATLAVKQRLHLQLGVFSESEDRTRGLIPEVRDKDRISGLSSDPKTLLNAEMELLAMERLETLVVGQFEETKDDQTGILSRRTQKRFLLVNLLVSKNSSTLKQLVLSDQYIVPELLFPNLEHLSCGRVTSALITGSPALKRLFVSEISLETMRRLPETLVSYSDAGIWNDGIAVGHALSHLTELQHINLRIGGDGRSLDKVFAQFKKLKSLHLILDLDGDDVMDSLFHSLAENNPELQDLRIGRITITDGAIHVLSRLKNLTHVEIQCKDYGPTGPAIAAYIGSTSPKVLNYFSIRADHMFPDFNARKVAQEVEKREDGDGRQFRCSFTHSISRSH